MRIRIMTMSMVAACPIMSWDASHYRDDGTCLCPPGTQEVVDQAEV